MSYFSLNRQLKKFAKLLITGPLPLLSTRAMLYNLAARPWTLWPVHFADPGNSNHCMPLCVCRSLNKLRHACLYLYHHSDINSYYVLRFFTSLTFTRRETAVSGYLCVCVLYTDSNIISSMFTKHTLVKGANCLKTCVVQKEWCFLQQISNQNKNTKPWMY